MSNLINNIANKMLKTKAYGMYKCDYDQSFGELITHLHLVKSKFDKNKGKSLRYFLCKCAQNKVLNMRRKWFSERSRGTPEDLVDKKQVEPVYKVINDELISSVDKLALSEKQREMIKMYYSHPTLSLSDVADTFSCSRQYMSSLNKTMILLVRKNLELYN